MVVIEHNLDVIKSADYIMIWDRRRSRGGEIVVQEPRKRWPEPPPIPASSAGGTGGITGVETADVR